jgi:hypothetical protein
MPRDSFLSIAVNKFEFVRSLVKEPISPEVLTDICKSNLPGRKTGVADK